MTSELTPSLSDFPDRLGAICENVAQVGFNSLTLAPQDATPTPLWELDRRAFMKEFGSDLPHTWMHNCLFVYLLEASHQLDAIASLLISRKYHAAVHPLVRGIVERIGAVNWILSEEATHRQRGLRSCIAFVVSIDPYLKAMKGMKVEANTREDFKRQQALVENATAGWFGAPTQPIQPDSDEPTTDRTKWSYEGESYPGFNKLCKLSLERGNLSRSTASAMYDVLCGFTHPNLFFGREHLLAEDQRIILDYSDDDLERYVRVAVNAAGEGLKRWACYFEDNKDAVVTQIDANFDQLDRISVL